MLLMIWCETCNVTDLIMFNFQKNICIGHIFPPPCHYAFNSAKFQKMDVWKKWPQKNVKHEFFFRQTTPTTLDFNYPWPIVKKISIVWFGWWQYTEVSREHGRLIAAATIHCSKNGKIVQLKLCGFTIIDYPKG